VEKQSLIQFLVQMASLDAQFYIMDGFVRNVLEFLNKTNEVYMKNKTILELAIEKAVRGGYRKYMVNGMMGYLESPDGQKALKRRKDYIASFRKDKIKHIVEKTGIFNWTYIFGHNHIYNIIFSHDFAKAFWGEAEIFLIDQTPGWAHDPGDIKLVWVNEKQIEDNDVDMWLDDKESWQYHLQQMVLEKEPIKYLEKFI